jgi:hypothetical protein
MDTLHDAMSTLNTMSKSLPIQLHAWLFHVAKTQKKKQRGLASNTDQGDPVQKSSCKWSGEHAGARRSSVYYAAQILHRQQMGLAAGQTYHGGRYQHGTEAAA